MTDLCLQYAFILDNNEREVFDLHLDCDSLRLIDPTPTDQPAWARLGFHQCPHCLFQPEDHPSCPLAASLAHAVSRFDRILSFDTVRVLITTPERIVEQNTTAQRGLCSLMGLIIATCECPYTDFFKPMARFHLPFSSEEETIWRATSSYLLAQYFRKRDGHEVDFAFAGLDRIYRNIHTVNVAVANRIRAASEKDSAVNAIILLDMFATTMPLVIGEALEELRPLFAPFLNSVSNLAGKRP
jgi:hypothetical protein